MVSDNYFDVLGIRPLAGRTFAPGDATAGGPAVVVNRGFAEGYFEGVNPVGQSVRLSPNGSSGTGLTGTRHEIVGVVGSFGTNPENSARDAAIYHPLAPGEINPVRFTVEVAGDP